MAHTTTQRRRKRKRKSSGASSLPLLLIALGCLVFVIFLVTQADTSTPSTPTAKPTPPAPKLAVAPKPTNNISEPLPPAPKPQKLAPAEPEPKPQPESKPQPEPEPELELEEPTLAPVEIIEEPQGPTLDERITSIHPSIETSITYDQNSLMGNFPIAKSDEMPKDATCFFSIPLKNGEVDLDRARNLIFYLGWPGHNRFKNWTETYDKPLDQDMVQKWGGAFVTVVFSKIRKGDLETRYYTVPLRDGVDNACMLSLEAVATITGIPLAESDITCLGLSSGSSAIQQFTNQHPDLIDTLMLSGGRTFTDPGKHKGAQFLMSCEADVSVYQAHKAYLTQREKLGLQGKHIPTKPKWKKLESGPGADNAWVHNNSGFHALLALGLSMIDLNSSDNELKELLTQQMKAQEPCTVFTHKTLPHLKIRHNTSGQASDRVLWLDHRFEAGWADLTAPVDLLADNDISSVSMPTALLNNTDLESTAAALVKKFNPTIIVSRDANEREIAVLQSLSSEDRTLIMIDPYIPNIGNAPESPYKSMVSLSTQESYNKGSIGLGPEQVYLTDKITELIRLKTTGQSVH